MKVLTKLSFGNPDDERFGILIIIFAILGVYTLNISIQSLQMGLRTLVIESCPESQQETVRAWVSRMTGVGNIIGYPC
jgi:solute carrier family 45 protein 1/2/4